MTLQEKINIDGKTWGVRSGNTVRKYVREGLHLFRKWDSWGVDADMWDTLVDDGVETLEILDSQRKLLYTISMDMTYVDHKKDWGHGYQYFVPRRYFEVKDATEAESLS